MRLAILTSVDVRHRYFVHALRKNHHVVAVAYERIGYAQAAIVSDDLSNEEAHIVAEHYAERVRQEQHFFGHDAAEVSDGPDCRVRHLEPGTLNTAATMDFLTLAGAEMLVVFGTNLIKAPLLPRWSGRIVNMHLGLSPYYRGTATNFYPLVNDEPQYVGATIHVIDAGIDSGPILAHARPAITADDRPHTIGCKAIAAGIDAMSRVLALLEQGTITPVPQWKPEKPRLYLRKDYHPRQVVELYRKIEAGMIADYVRNRATRSALRLVTIPEVMTQTSATIYRSVTASTHTPVNAATQSSRSGQVN